MATVLELLSKNLRRIITEKNITQVDLAERAKVTFQSVNSCVSGRRSVSLGLISTIAKALNVPESDLIAPEQDELLDNPDIKEILGKLKAMPPGRRAFTIENWVSELMTNKLSTLHMLPKYKPGIQDVIPDEIAEGIMNLTEEKRTALLVGVGQWLKMGDHNQKLLLMATDDYATTKITRGSDPTKGTLSARKSNLKR